MAWPPQVRECILGYSNAQEESKSPFVSTSEELKAVTRKLENSTMSIKKMEAEIRVMQGHLSEMIHQMNEMRKLMETRNYGNNQ